MHVRNEHTKSYALPIGSNESLEGDALPPEITELLGTEASVGFMRDPFLYMNGGKKIHKGKSSVPINMALQNLVNLSSLRGNVIKINSYESHRNSNTLNHFLLYAVEHPFKALLKTVFSYRGVADILPGFINYPVAAVTTLGEFFVKATSALFTKPLRKTKRQFTAYADEKNMKGKILTGALMLVCFPFWAVGQTLACAGNVLSYCRHIVDGVMSLFSWGISAVTKQIKLLNDTSTYANPRFVLKSIGKNLTYLIPTAAVTAAAFFVPGGQILPALMSSFGSATAGMTAIAVGSGLAIGCQAASGGLRMAFQHAGQKPSSNRSTIGTYSPQPSPPSSTYRIHSNGIRTDLPVLESSRSDEPPTLTSDNNAEHEPTTSLNHLGRQFLRR